MKKHISCNYLIITSLLNFFAAVVVAQTPYKAEWKSLDKHTMPIWYNDAKIGLSICWGVYSVPTWAPRVTGISYAEWYGQKMFEKDNPTAIYHKENYGENFIYEDFIPMFKAEQYNPNEWALFAKNMGAKYIFITSKHHDGFCLWDTKYTDRNSMKMGPKKDLLKEFFEAGCKNGLKVGLYYSLLEWNNPMLANDSMSYGATDKANYPYTGLKKMDNYVNDFMVPQIKELIDMFHPDFFYFDGEWDKPETFWKMREVVAYFYNEAQKRDQEVFVNDRFGAGTRGKHGDLYNIEYDNEKHLEAILTHKWSYWQGIAKTFGYNRDTDPQDCLSPKQFIDKVVIGVSKNGNFDINVGPTAQGLIPEYEQYPLLKLGEWLKVNSEAIYGTRYWDKIQQEGDACFTTKDNFVYAIFLKWQGSEFKLKNVKPIEGSTIQMLGVSGNLKWNWDVTNGLIIIYPQQKARPTACSYAWAFKIKIK